MTTNFSDQTQWFSEYFSRFRVPEVIVMDGGPLFNGVAWKKFLAKWGIHHCLCSAMNPESNSRAELRFKVAKRLIKNNISRAGDPNTNKVMRALLQYLNTPI